MSSKGRVFDIAEFTARLKMVIQAYITRFRSDDDTCQASSLILSPNSLKKIATDNGRIGKEYIWRFCNARFGTDFLKSQGDEADSFICAITPILMTDSDYRDKTIESYDTIKAIKALKFSQEMF